MGICVIFGITMIGVMNFFYSFDIALLITFH